MISANASRVLCAMGLREQLDKCSIHLKRVVFKRFDDGSVLDERLYNNTEAELGGPNWQIHRADLHDVLLMKAQEMGLQISMGAKVSKYNQEAPSVVLEDGEVVRGDVILVADGKSSDRGHYGLCLTVL